MKSKKGLIVLAVVLVAVIAGAYALYNSLDDRVETNQLAAAVTPSPSPDAPGDAARPEPPSQPPEQQDAPAANGGDGGYTEEPADASVGDAADGAEEEIPLAPDFTVYDEQGNAHTLSDFRGKPVVLNFWASWCGPCKSEMPDFDSAWAEYGGDIHFLMVNVTDSYQETLESASEFISESGYSFPVYYDTELSASSAYGVYSLPMTYFIDAEGFAVAYGRGAMSREVLESGIAMIYTAGAE